MEKQLPLVAAAFVCEKVLRELDQVVSAIRIADTYTVKLVSVEKGAMESEGPPPDRIIAATHGGLLNMTALIILKAGAVTGPHEVTLLVRNPEGKETAFPNKFPVNFTRNDPAEGAQFTIQFVMPGNAAAGLYWIDVRWDGDVLTNIPIKLVRESESPETAVS